jgi:hypothetical protein
VGWAEADSEEEVTGEGGEGGEADSEEEVTGEGEASEGAAMVAAGQWKERGERADMSEQS